MRWTVPSRGFFPVPLAKWFRGEMGHYLERKLNSKNEFASADYLNTEVVRQLIAEHRQGRADNSRALWLVWMFENFLERERDPRRTWKAAPAEQVGLTS